MKAERKKSKERKRTALFNTPPDSVKVCLFLGFVVVLYTF